MTIEPILIYLCLLMLMFLFYKICYFRALIDSRVENQKQLDRLDAQNTLQIKNLTNKYKLIVNQLLDASQKGMPVQQEEEEVDFAPVPNGRKKEDLN